MERSKLKYMSLLITMMMIFQIIILYAASGAEAHVENIFSNEDRGFKEIRITDRQYNGNRLNVGGTGIGNYSSIQLALASSSDGDRIIVHPGTYPEAVTVNTEVWIKGSGNAGLTNPGGLYNGFTLNANNITITGMNITDFLNGIFADTSSGHNISGNSFRGNFVNFAKMLTTIPLSVDLMDHGLTFTNNVMGYTSGNYVNFYYENEMYFDSVSMCNLTMGEILIKNNTFLDHSVQTNLFFRISISSIGGGGSVKVGDVQIVENEFHGGDIGIDIYMDSNSLANVSLEIGDLLIRDNMVLNYTVRGIEIDYWSFCKLYGTTSGTIGDCMISDNFLKTERVDALSININGFEYFREIRDSVSLVRGNFSILRNTIDSDRGTGIDITSIHTGYQIKGSSKILTGDLIIKENRIRNSSIGVFYRSGTIEEISGDTLFSKGNIIVEDNMMDTANVGIYLRLEALGYRMSGGSSVVLGDVIMRGNKIKAVDQGAQIFTSMLGHSLNDTASFSMGSISFTDNHVEAYHGYYNHYMGNIGRNLSNGSSFSFSDLNISSNTIISSSIGISFGIIEYLGTELYDHANFSFGSIIVDQNDIDSRDTGIRSNSIQMVGTTLGGTSSFSMGTLSVSRNKIISHGHSIHFGSIQSFGSNMMGGSKFEIEGFHFDGNDLRSNGTALHLDNIMEFGNFNFDLTSFIMGDVTINNNEIISGDDGVMINLIGNFGMDLHYRASFEMGSMIITNNAITTMSGNGIFLKDLLNFAVLLHDNSSMNMGSIKVGYNNVNSSLSGIKLGSIQFFGYQLWDWSKFEMGRLEFMDNGIISETGYGIHIPKIYNMGSCLNDRSSFHHEGIWIEDNTMEVNTSGVNIIGLGLLAQNVLHDSTVSMDGVHIVKNTMYSQNGGIE
ncbi:MAG: hypothetical protein U9R75_03580, partial [Candidatus Thermoplasmatota archaeon]|nr:hypothetical protein [Candidatus Thermoplasmatota archaeon]